MIPAGTYPVAAPGLILEDDVTVDGVDAWSTILTIPPGNQHRIFDVAQDVVAVIRGLTIREPAATLAQSGGAIRSDGFLHVERVWFDDNSVLRCGALQARADTLIKNSTFSRNSAETMADGGALCVEMGAHVNVISSTFVGNSAQRRSDLRLLDGKPPRTIYVGRKHRQLPGHRAHQQRDLSR